MTAVAEPAGRPPALAPAAPRRVRLFGETVETELPFRTPMAPAPAGPCGLELRVVGERPPLRERGRLLLASRLTEGGEGGELRVFTSPGHDRFALGRGVEIVSRRRSIEVFAEEVAAEWAEALLLGAVAALRLERRGIPVLHGAAVEVGERVAALLGAKRAGKSSLAAALIGRGGVLLSDDLVAVETHGPGFRVRPSYPQLRLSPEAAARFHPEPDRLPPAVPSLGKRRLPIGPGAFAADRDRPCPLGAIYLLDRRATDAPGARLEALPPAEALLELCRHGFLRRLVAAAGLQPGRLERLGRIVERVPVARLVYPSGYGALSEVTTLLTEDLAATLPGPG